MSYFEALYPGQVVAVGCGECDCGVLPAHPLVVLDRVFSVTLDRVSTVSQGSFDRVSGARQCDPSPFTALLNPAVSVDARYALMEHEESFLSYLKEPSVQDSIALDGVSSALEALACAVVASRP